MAILRLIPHNRFVFPEKTQRMHYITKVIRILLVTGAQASLRISVIALFFKVG